MLLLRGLRLRGIANFPTAHIPPNAAPLPLSFPLLFSSTAIFNHLHSLIFDFGRPFVTEFPLSRKTTIKLHFTAPFFNFPNEKIKPNKSVKMQFSKIAIFAFAASVFAAETETVYSTEEITVYSCPATG